MRTLYLDCGMGAAGDMLNAALYELLDDAQRKLYLEKMNALGLEGVTVRAETSSASASRICLRSLSVTR